MDIAERISGDVCRLLYDAICEADGNEIFAVGTLDSGGVVCEAFIAARGHESAVPVSPKAVRDASVLIHNHPSGVLRPSDADLGVASRTAQNGQGFYIINNSVTDVFVVVEPVQERPQLKIDTDAVAAMLSAGGTLDDMSASFEERPSQIALLRHIADVFNKDGIGVFEAGTGVGKSYAYLLPSVIWSLDNKERIVISTGTINLQQQLVEKDIPMAEKICGRAVKAVLMKGRQNYICRRRFSDAQADRDLFSEESEELELIGRWIETTSTGSRSDLSFVPSETVWSRINSESEACMGMRCPFRENCFVMQVRKAAADANLIIVNHHLLFADLEARMAGAGYDDTAVLPPFRRIVFDEAHGMESAATSFFSEQFTRFKILKQTALLYRVRRGAAAGHLFTLEALSPASGRADEAVAAIEKVKACLAGTEEAALDIVGSAFSWRLSDSTAARFGPLGENMQQLRSAIASCTGIFREIIDGIPEDDQENAAVWETRQILRRLESVGTLCQYFTEWDQRRDSIFWVEKNRLTARSFPGRKKQGSEKGTVPAYYPRFAATPLDIAPVMVKGVFEPFPTVICTSATLRTGNSFSFWMKRSGVALVEQDSVVCGEFPSPFRYDKNLLLAIPTDAPLPDNLGFQQYVEQAIVSLVRSSEGRAFVLFTSYESLGAACATARRELAGTGIRVFKQGDDDRARLLDMFRNDESSVLFATDSFWEGVDVPGETLSHVIIVKLPFPVPSDPVFAARCEAVERSGGSAFMDLSLPEAVIRFRQGTGRLLRRSTDRGVVTVLDRRILEKRYGRVFLESIPETKQIFEPLARVTGKIGAFLFG